MIVSCLGMIIVRSDWTRPTLKLETTGYINEFGLGLWKIIRAGDD
jgi:hypothetical protein